jgi:hypothetical protein
MVGCELGSRQDISEIVLDSRDRGTQCREPGLLLQEAVEIALHRCEFAFGDADLVLARRGADDARGIFRIVMERNHGARDAPHGTDHDDVEAGEYKHAA